MLCDISVKTVYFWVVVGKKITACGMCEQLESTVLRLLVPDNDVIKQVTGIGSV